MNKQTKNSEIEPLAPCPCDCGGHLVFHKSTFEQYDPSTWSCNKCAYKMDTRTYAGYVLGNTRQERSLTEEQLRYDIERKDKEIEKLYYQIKELKERSGLDEKEVMNIIIDNINWNEQEGEEKCAKLICQRFSPQGLKPLSEEDERDVYQFMIDYLPELCPRNNETGAELQMGIKAIQRGKKIIKAVRAKFAVPNEGLNERIEILERIAKSAREFVIDASGSWDTYQGEYILEQCKLLSALENKR